MVSALIYGGFKFLFVIWSGKFFQRRLHPPDLTGVLGDGAIAGELATASNVVNRLLGPFFGVLMWRSKRKRLRNRSCALAFGTVKSRAYLVKSVNLLLAFNVVFVVSKDLESVQRARRLMRTSTMYGAIFCFSVVT